MFITTLEDNACSIIKISIVLRVIEKEKERGERKRERERERERERN